MSSTALIRRTSGYETLPDAIQPTTKKVVPAFPWMGGKSWLAREIGQHLALSRKEKKLCYVEPFAGAAAMLLALPKANVEVLNDRNQDLIHFYRVLQQPDLREQLLERLYFTPYARDFFREALHILQDLKETDAVTRAWAFFVVSNAAFSGGGQSNITEKRFATSTQRSQGRRMRYHREGCARLIERLQDVVMENLPAMAIFQQYDSPKTLFFVDPPYYPATRKIQHENSRGTYAGGEMDAIEHMEMLATCKALTGWVALCGYSHPDYDRVLLDDGWEVRRFPKKAMASLHHDTDASQREECVWLNPRLAQHFRSGQATLF